MDHVVMDYAVIILAASLTAVLTFFSGFGLGTLLMPVFALFFPLPPAIAATALVHLANNLLKAGLVARHADRRVLLRFALPAIPAAFLGVALLERLGDLPPLHAYVLVAGQGGLGLMAVATLSAFAGSYLGKRLLKKITLPMLRRGVAGFLLLFSGALVSGLI
jgi:uncharacterized membrane protein YfcA